MTSIKNFFRWLFYPPTSAHPAVILIRLLVGGVFLSEGIIKFLFNAQGVIRFTKISIPIPEIMSNFVGGLEIVGGICLILGLLTRFFSVIFIFEMIVAILTTKITLYLGTSPLPAPPIPPQVGIWAVFHEGRPDYAQVLGLIFFLIVGPGKWSLDAFLFKKRYS